MWTKPDVAAKVKMWGILWTTGSWIVMSMTAKQGATRTKLEIYCNRKTSNWRKKEDNHLKIKKHGGSAHKSRICRGRTTVYFGKAWVTSNIFCLHSKLKRWGQLFCIFSTFFVNISLLLLHIIQRFAATLLKEVNLENGANK